MSEIIATRNFGHLSGLVVKMLVQVYGHANTSTNLLKCSKQRKQSPRSCLESIWYEPLTLYSGDHQS